MNQEKEKSSKECDISENWTIEMLKKLLLLFSILQLGTVFSQKTAYEIGIISENDLYTSLINDKYYTNGLGFYFSYLNHNVNPKINKTSTTFKINQSVFTPKIRNVNFASKVDRPPAGLIFAEIKKNYFYQSESVLKIGFQIGFVGPNAFAKETQKILHQFLGIDQVQGWQFQIKNSLALQTNILFSKKIPFFKNTQKIDFHLQTETNLGTALAGTTLGFSTRIGLKKLLPIFDSNYFGGALNKNKEAYKSQREAYFYVNSGVNYQLFDATFQGSIFGDSSPITFDLMPFRFVGAAGFKYRKKNLNLSYSFVYQGKEARNNKITGYYYGSIGIGFLF